MKINTSLGYKPVTFSELTDDESFWKGCSSCINYDILSRTNRKHCLCTGMLFDPADEKKFEKTEQSFARKSRLYERWLRLKKRVLYNRYEQRKEEKVLS
jgi:hypothetical protein